MITIRRAGERGYFDHGWLKTYHTFSFADYQDPKWMGFRPLRVINEDWVAPGIGFPSHSHRDMEIITYILEGELEHKDSMGNTARIRPGEVQRMTAGSGVTHSEFNPSKDKPVHLLQIWIFPETKNLTPGYEQKSYSREEKLNRWRLVASSSGEAGSVTIHQDAGVYSSILEKDQKLVYELTASRYAWIHLVRGAAVLNGQSLSVSDAAAVSGETRLELTAGQESEILLFDLP